MVLYRIFCLWMKPVWSVARVELYRHTYYAQHIHTHTSHTVIFTPILPYSLYYIVEREMLRIAMFFFHVHWNRTVQNPEGSNEI